MTAPDKASKNYNIQFIQGVAGDEFYITMQCGIEAEAAKLGVTVTTQGPQKFDPTLQRPILCARSRSQPCSSRQAFSRLVINPLLGRVTDRRRAPPAHSLRAGGSLAVACARGRRRSHS